VQGRNYDQVTEQNRGAYCHHLVIETFCRQNAALFSCQIEFSPSLTMPQNFGARFILRPVALFLVAKDQAYAQPKPKPKRAAMWYEPARGIGHSA
jgi:hypothetical protein